MFDVSTTLPDTPGALAHLGEVLGRAGISIEGGGVFTHEGHGHAHFLFADGEAAYRALQEAGIVSAAPRRVLRHKLRQAEPGQLGSVSRVLAKAGVNLEVMYSDHANTLVLVVDDLERAQAALRAWTER